MVGSRTGVVTSLNRSDGGVPKLAVDRVRVTVNGMDGDRQRNLKYHGGPDRALCLYSADLIEVLRNEGHSVVAGSIGENVTIAGLDWQLLQPGVAMTIGPIQIELTAFAAPCRNIGPSFKWRRSGRVSPRTHPGEARLYARVRTEGMVTVGDPVSIL